MCRLVDLSPAATDGRGLFFGASRTTEHSALYTWSLAGNCQKRANLATLATCGADKGALRTLRKDTADMARADNTGNMAAPAAKRCPGGRICTPPMAHLAASEMRQCQMAAIIKAIVAIELVGVHPKSAGQASGPASAQRVALCGAFANRLVGMVRIAQTQNCVPAKLHHGTKQWAAQSAPAQMPIQARRQSSSSLQKSLRVITYRKKTDDKTQV